MKRLLASILLFLAFLPWANADMAVIANAKNSLDFLTPQQVQDIFLGRSRVFPNGKFALPIDQSSSMRAEFYQRLTGRPLEQINAYWARIIFTGQASPPLQLPDDLAVLQTVRENEGAIGYIDRVHADRSVHILLVLPQ
jgi:ABC-type phosphate transport system substrate-binding protein